MSQVTNDPSLPQTPKAVVKPQVLTHVIDGHVIKESSAPFPLSPSKSKFVFFHPKIVTKPEVIASVMSAFRL